MTPDEVQALGKAVDVAKDYADSVVKGPLSELGGILSDTVGYWRLKNQVPTQQELVHPSYTKVLAQLSPIDARLMVEFRKFTSDKKYRELGLRGGTQVVHFLAEIVNMPNRVTYLSCLNLERLGIVQHLGFLPPEGHPHPDVFRDSMEHQEFRISEYGIAFWDACHYRDNEKG